MYMYVNELFVDCRYWPIDMQPVSQSTPYAVRRPQLAASGDYLIICNFKLNVVAKCKDLHLPFKGEIGGTRGGRDVPFGQF
jgi:hypothetical protein